MISLSSKKVSEPHSPKPPATMTLPPRHPATKSALFSFILDILAGLIQVPAARRGQERTQKKSIKLKIKKNPADI